MCEQLALRYLPQFSVLGEKELPILSPGFSSETNKQYSEAAQMRSSWKNLQEKPYNNTRYKNATPAACKLLEALGDRRISDIEKFSKWRSSKLGPIIAGQYYLNDNVENTLTAYYKEKISDKPEDVANFNQLIVNIRNEFGAKRYRQATPAAHKLLGTLNGASVTEITNFLKMPQLRSVLTNTVNGKIGIRRKAAGALLAYYKEKISDKPEDLANFSQLIVDMRKEFDQNKFQREMEWIQSGR